MKKKSIKVENNYISNSSFLRKSATQINNKSLHSRIDKKNSEIK